MSEAAVLFIYSREGYVGSHSIYFFIASEMFNLASVGLFAAISPSTQTHIAAA